MPDPTQAGAAPENLLEHPIKPPSPSRAPSSDTNDSSDAQSTEGTEMTSDTDEAKSCSSDSTVLCEDKHTSMALLIPAAYLTVFAVASVAGPQIAREVEVAATTNMESTVETITHTESKASERG